MKIAVIGDMCFDQYIGVRRDGTTREDPKIDKHRTVQNGTAEYQPGGALNLAAQLGALGHDVVPVGVVGTAGLGSNLVIGMISKMVHGTAERICLVKRWGEYILWESKAAPSLKTRCYAAVSGNLIARIDSGLIDPDPHQFKFILAKIKAMLIVEKPDGVVICDHHKLIATNDHRRELFAMLRDAGVPVVVDTGTQIDLTSWPVWFKPKAVLMGLASAKAADATVWDSYRTLDTAACRMRTVLGNQAELVVVTDGANGFGWVFNEATEGGVSRADCTYETGAIGAGDALTALVSSTVFANVKYFKPKLVGGGFDKFAKIVAASLPVGCRGTVNLLRGFRGTLFEGEENRSAPLARATEKLPWIFGMPKATLTYRQRGTITLIHAASGGRPIAVTNGCFDILHEGHFRVLKRLRTCEENPYTVVLLNDDEHVRQLKGEGRPVRSLEHRMRALEELPWVDSVIPFGSDDELALLIEELDADFLVKGADWQDRAQELPGYDFIREKGGLEFVSFVEGASTTGIVNFVKGEARGTT